METNAKNEIDDLVKMTKQLVDEINEQGIYNVYLDDWSEGHATVVVEKKDGTPLKTFFVNMLGDSPVIEWFMNYIHNDHKTSKVRFVSMNDFVKNAKKYISTDGISRM